MTMRLAMDSSSFSLNCRLRLIKPYCSRVRVRVPPQARYQSSRDEGNSWDTVDAGMSVLRYRIEQVRIKEGLSMSSTCEKGWNYRYDVVQKKPNQLLMLIELAAIVGSNIALVLLSGALCIFLVAFISNRSLTN